MKAVLGSVLLIMLTAMVAVPTAGAAEPDWDIPNGHFFTQTADGGVAGYAITDDGDIPFWSEFQRLGDAEALGYPITRRFEWNGYISQAMQRAVFQWRPETGEVSFANVFDLMTQAKKDDWALTVRQTPKPGVFHDAGKSWQDIVDARLAILDTNPAIKAQYYAVPGDPLLMNGLPTSEVADMGDSYTLRAQRVVIQQWKRDMPWARAGEVTIALGGSMAKEAGLLPTKIGLDPEKVHVDREKGFAVSYPYNWSVQDIGSDVVAFVSRVPDGSGFFPNANVGVSDAGGATLEDLEEMFRSGVYGRVLSSMGYSNYKPVSTTIVSLNGTRMVRHALTGDMARDPKTNLEFIQYIAIREEQMFVLTVASSTQTFAKNDPTFDWMASTFKLLE
ncbi:MAG: hypothetical protein M1370_02805 [Bacteroidetes bacterium]|nr:hypothetical protein [Bacteroidota bacterium]